MVKGYLPPEGPQNVHGVPYTYAQGQGAHRIRNKVVYGPEEVILTGDEGTHKICERAGLTELPQEVAEQALAARNGETDATVAEVIEEWAGEGAEPAEGSEAEPDETEEAIEEAEDEEPAGATIPADLREQYEDGSLPYRGDGDEVTLQQLAQAYGIPANQGADDLLDALEEVRDS